MGNEEDVTQHRVDTSKHREDVYSTALTEDKKTAGKLHRGRD